MLNRYPLWKYILLILILIIGLLYALPNLYGEDPAIQVTGLRGVAANKSLLIQVKNILKQHHLIIKSIILKNGIILVCFSNSDSQLRAGEILMKTLDQNHIVAFNLEATTPSWLTNIGASPMKLGLDLRGGVYFLIKVNLNSTLNKLYDQIIENIKVDLNKKSIPYFINKNENYSSKIYFYDIKTRDRVMRLLTNYHYNLVINSIKDRAIKIALNNAYLCQLREQIIQQNVNILYNRINQLGISEPLVQRQNTDQIIVELPGIQNTTSAKEILGATATLELHLVKGLINQIDNDNQYMPKDLEKKLTNSGQPIILYKKTILTGNHINYATYSIDEYGRPQVNIFLDDIGGTTMFNFTKDNIGKLIATLFIEYNSSGKKDVDGRDILEKKENIINIATIQSRLGSNFSITGINNIKEAHQLALLLRSGALSAPIQIIEERMIGPAMGLQNIIQGIKACLWGLIASILFMVLWYRKFGIIASIAFIANLILVVGIISVLPGATLTMPGIAGILLTLAMTIDANVLINERIKEELRNGRTVQRAIHEGYRCAFSTIFDSNVTALITAIILYVIGTGSVKGFALTTIIGIFTSIFTSTVCTRAIVNLIYGGKSIKKLSI